MAKTEKTASEILRKMFTNTMKDIDKELKDAIYTSVPKEKIERWALSISSYVDAIQSEEEKKAIEKTKEEPKEEEKDLFEEEIEEEREEVPKLKKRVWDDVPKEKREKYIKELKEWYHKSKEKKNMRYFNGKILSIKKIEKIIEVPKEIIDGIKNNSI